VKNNIKPICIIPARGGSKRIKNKNIIDFFGKPIIYYSINVAKKSKLFSRVIVTTDSLKIAKIAKKYGAEVPFIRSKNLSNDKVGIKPVIVDCIKKIKYQNNFFFLIYATNPLLNYRDLQKAYKKIIRLNCKSLLGIKKFETYPFKAISINKQKINFHFKNMIKQNSQNYKDFYYDDGSFSIFETKSYLKRKNFYSRDMTFFLNKKNETVDLNNKEDLRKIKKIYISKFKPQN